MKNEGKQDKIVDKFKIYDNLIIEEDREKGNVNMQLYFDYFKLLGGVKFAVLILFVKVMWIGSQLFANICNYMQKYLKGLQNGAKTPPPLRAITTLKFTRIFHFRSGVSP